MKYFGGIEGGATRSSLVICDEQGNSVSALTGPDTNHWQIGIPECAKRIAEMVNRGKIEAEISPKERLYSLGLSLSGCEQESTNMELEQYLRNNYPDLAENYVVSSDTLGSLYTASDKGGIVVIAGTGSNTLLRNPDGTTYNCGGWGHLLGDEGSAYYISHRAVKIVFDHLDNLVLSEHSIETVWTLIKQHFKVETRLDLLPHCYAKFEKHNFAGLCVKLAKAAEDGDALSRMLFREAGTHIAKSILALLPKAHKDLLVAEDLYIVCVGSVWLSWHLMEDGFVSTLDRDIAETLHGLKLIRLTADIAYGACYLGADAANFALPRNYKHNFTEIYHQPRVTDEDRLEERECNQFCY